MWRLGFADYEDFFRCKSFLLRGSLLKKIRGCLKREADVFLTKFNFIKRRLCFGNFKSFRNMVVETI